MKLDIADWRTNGHGMPIFIATLPVAHINGGFRGAIEVVQLHIVTGGENLLLQCHVQGFTTTDQPFELWQLLQAGGSHEGFQHGRHKVQRGDPFIRHDLL